MIFLKIANFGNFFIECISNCIIAQEFSKLSKLVFYLGKKIVCSKKILASFQKHKSFLISSRMCTKIYYCPRTLKTFRFWPSLEKEIEILKKNHFELFRKRLTSHFFSNASRNSLLLMWSEEVKTLDFLQKDMPFLRKNTWKFSKTLNTDTFLRMPFRKHHCSIELKTFNSLRFHGK